MTMCAGDYVIITATGRRAMVLEVSSAGLFVQPLTRNSKDGGKQIKLSEIHVQQRDVSRDTYRGSGQR